MGIGKQYKNNRIDFLTTENGIFDCFWYFIVKIIHFQFGTWATKDQPMESIILIYKICVYILYKIWHSGGKFLSELWSSKAKIRTQN